LVPLARPGPWSGVSALIGYGARLWFVNSVPFVDHNSADVYSYDPVTGDTRYERHLFSQDAGSPVVAAGLLYWPFEDARFSMGLGEYMVTNGRDWSWRVLPEGEVFHVHAMTVLGHTLFAATSAWRAGLQRSDDGGVTWRIIYDHPTPPRQVSRLTNLVLFRGALYAGLTALNGAGPRLLRLVDDAPPEVGAWPSALAVTALQPYDGWLYGVTLTPGDHAVWRTDGVAVQRVVGLDGVAVRALAAGSDAIWAVSARPDRGTLWRSGDGIAWRPAYEFREAEPLDVRMYAGRPYVGTLGPEGHGTLWGPPVPAPIEAPVAALPLPGTPGGLRPAEVAPALEGLDRALDDPRSYADHGRRLRAWLEPLARSRTPEIGHALAGRLGSSVPAITLPLFGGAVQASAASMARWSLLWAMARTGHGRVPPAFLSAPWTAAPNRTEKYLEAAPAAAWAVAELAQADDETVGTLIERLGGRDHPRWLDGDLIGALTVLTGERFGYDVAAWRQWWGRRRAAEPR
jgi:hypothetical protein